MNTKPEQPQRAPSTQQTTVSFEGIPSGDNESFCWDVTRETFLRVTGAAPDEEHDASYFNPGKFRLYPRDLIPTTDSNVSRPYKFTLHTEPVTETALNPSISESSVNLSENSLPKAE